MGLPVKNGPGYPLYFNSEQSEESPFNCFLKEKKDAATIPKPSLSDFTFLFIVLNRLKGKLTEQLVL